MGRQEKAVDIVVPKAFESWAVPSGGVAIEEEDDCIFLLFFSCCMFGKSLSLWEVGDEANGAVQHCFLGHAAVGSGANLEATGVISVRHILVLLWVNQSSKVHFINCDFVIGRLLSRFSIGILGTLLPFFLFGGMHKKWWSGTFNLATRNLVDVCKVAGQQGQACEKHTTIFQLGTQWTTK